MDDDGLLEPKVEIIENNTLASVRNRNPENLLESINYRGPLIFDSYKCNLCTKQYLNIKHLETHVRERHQLLTSKKCHVCNKQFKRTYHLRRHVTVHDNENECKLCLKRFKSPEGKSVHTCSRKYEKKLEEDAAVTGRQEPTSDEDTPPITASKAYVCQYCAKGFESASALIIHERIHTGEKPFICTECGSKFNNAGALTAHVNRHFGIKPFECETCQKRFVRSSELQKHLFTHAETKQFECHVCQKQFSRRDVLKIHMNKHTGETIFPCVYCNRAFTRRSHLIVHTRRHTGEKPFNCTQCEKAFAQSILLKRHFSKYHILQHQKDSQG